MTICWTDERKQLAELLAAQLEDVGSLYRLAIDTLSQDPLTRPQLMVGSHCIREMFAPLLDAQNIAKPKRSDVSGPAQSLAAAWLGAGLGDKPDASEETDANELRAIPNDVFAAARSVVAAAAKGSENAESVMALIAIGPNAKTNTGLLKRLSVAQRKFTTWSHHVDYSKGVPSVPTSAEVEAQLRIVEQVLLTRLGNRADRVHNIQEMLGRANSKAEGSES